MFSPSLISILIHTLWPLTAFRSEYEDLGDFAQDAARLVKPIAVVEWPELPVLARTNRSAHEIREAFGERVQLADARGSAGTFFWGRLAANDLARYLGQRWETAAADEYLDLGTSLDVEAGGAAAAQACRSLLKGVGAPANADVCVAFVDRGDPKTGAPEDFGGKVEHIQTTDIELSDHALKVLHVLAERLVHHGILSKTQIICALVAPPTNIVGMKCFDHANGVELFSALQALDTRLASVSIPVAFNLSMGTHVGPHDGQSSPLEDFFASMARQVPRKVYAHVSAGNDGLYGVHEGTALDGGMPEIMTVKTAPVGCTELLIELWWEDPGPFSLSAKVDVHVHGKPAPFGATLRITNATSNPVLSPPFAGPVVRQSLLHSKCVGNMSCIALALTATDPLELASATIDITLESSVDLVVNAWIAASSHEGTTFARGGPAGTIRVPATSDAVLCVSGCDQNGKPWLNSSRGPGYIYGGTIAHAHLLPHLAHLVDYSPTSVDAGTSYASARACADTAEIVCTSVRRGNCATLSGWLGELLQAAPSTWHPRIGYGAISH